MGIFWNEPATPQRPEVARDAEPGGASARETVAATALNAANLIVALLIVAVLIGAGIATQAAHLTASSAALFSLATTAFGIVVGLLTGEKPRS